MSFTLNIETGNAAMLTAEDVADALMTAAKDLRDGHDHRPIYDYNGNRVGSWTLDLPEPEDEDIEMCDHATCYDDARAGTPFCDFHHESEG